MTLRTLNYGNYGIFLIMGNAGFCPSTELFTTVVRITVMKPAVHDLHLYYLYVICILTHTYDCNSKKPPTPSPPPSNPETETQNPQPYIASTRIPKRSKPQTRENSAKAQTFVHPYNLKP